MARRLGVICCVAYTAARALEWAAGRAYRVLVAYR